MSNFKKLIPFIKIYQKQVGLNIFFNILYALFGTMSFLTLIPMLDILFGSNRATAVTKQPTYQGITKLFDFLKDSLYYKINSFIEIYGIQYALTIVIGLIIFTFFLKNIAGYFASFFIMKVRNGVMKDLRAAMYKKVVSLPIAYYSERKKGDIMSRTLGDLGEVQNQFFVVLDLLIKDPLTIIFSIVAMFLLSYKLMIFVLIFIPISGFIISLVGKSLKKQSIDAQQETGNFISLLEESLSGLKVIKSYNAENTFISKFNASIFKLYSLSNKIGTKNNLASPMSEFMGILVIAVLLWYGGNLVMVEASLEGSDFISFMGLAYNILTPAKAISRASYSVKSGLAAAERVFAVLDQPNFVDDKPNCIQKQTFDSQITFEALDFKYENQLVLKQFSLSIPKGQTYAIVGQSGSGKSTLANLITRFYDVNAGNILIDNLNIKDMSMHSLRGLLGLVTQESILFNDTIKNNILIGKSDATDQEVIEALKIANAWEFVKDLPKGIETNIGDAGSKLSGGQKQRLNIARAVLKNPPIMILDEATSALDTESEKVVQDALENMMKNRTSIVIAHRLSTIKNADQIVVMHKGSIVEQGKHQELIALNGVYAKLVQLQSIEVS